MIDYFLKRVFHWVEDNFMLKFKEPVPDCGMPGCAGMTAEQILSLMTQSEKIAMLGGREEFAIRGIPRLGVPDFWTSDATSGSRGWNAPVTIFPSGVAMAGSWNPDLLEKCAKAIAWEARSLGISILLAPGVNIARVPTCGRNFEYMGEDPYLAGRMASAYIRGAQSGGVATTIKHFACNNSDYDRHKTNSVVDERSLREIYLPAFKAGIDAGSLGLMTAYNQVNGVYASQNRHLVQDILRREWGYQGLVVSDWNSLYDTAGPLKHGVDLEMPEAVWFEPEKVEKALAEGRIEQSDIDSRVLSILRTLEKTGALSRPAADRTRTLHSAETTSLAGNLAAESICLLKNEGSFLPLDGRKVKRIVISGWLSKPFMVPTGGGGSSLIRSRQHIVSLEEELKKRFPDAEISRSLSRKTLRKADLVIIQTGFGRIAEAEGYDRPYGLLKIEERRLRRASKYSSKVVAIVHSGGDYDTRSWIDGPQALLNAYYQGESGSQALADILFGKVNPSGKLPFTMARRFEDYPSSGSYPRRYWLFSLRRITVGQGNPDKRQVWDIGYTEGMKVGYRGFDTDRKPVAFPFGHGLSYTRFEYGSLDISSQAGGNVICTLTVKNTGDRPGSEVVQGYIHHQDSRIFHPEQELKAFCKVQLDPGECKNLKFEFDRDAFSYYDVEKGGFVVESGSCCFRFGSSSRDIRLSGVEMVK